MRIGDDSNSTKSKCFALELPTFVTSVISRAGILWQKALIRNSV